MRSSIRLKDVILVSIALLSPLPVKSDDGRSDGAFPTIESLQAQLDLQTQRITELESLLRQQKLLLDGLQNQLTVLVGREHPATAPAGTQAAKPPQSLSEAKKIEDAIKNLGGFKFTGDFRFRADIQLRSGNEVAPPLQNARSRYRLRLNFDKEIDPRFTFHLQLSTGPLNNGLTNDQDFGSGIARHPFMISNAYVDFHPNAMFSIRGGRLEEVFADGLRLLWDDSTRFSGFQQIVKLPLSSRILGFKRVEFRAGEYFLSNPNIAILSPTSPFVLAGFQPGRKVRSSNLFHPGLMFAGDPDEGLSHQFTADFQIYRNPDQINLSTLPAGFPVLISNGLGIALAGPMTATGNATTTAGGAIYHAPSFQIARLVYRLTHKGLRMGGREIPAWLDIQVSRNTGTSKARDALNATANIGAVRKFADMRFLYQFAIKDANSLISQFTDDDMGTQVGVNIAVHGLRFDLGLARFIQWQNVFFIQNALRPNNPADQFFVPIQRGANTTYRYISYLAFTF